MKMWHIALKQVNNNGEKLKEYSAIDEYPLDKKENSIGRYKTCHVRRF